MSWRGWVTLIFSIWLIIASLIPGIVSHKGANIADFLIVGLIFLIVGIVTVKSDESKGIGWVTLIIGIWLIISALIPGITGSKGGSMANGLIFGIITLILSFFNKKRA